MVPLSGHTGQRPLEGDPDPFLPWLCLLGEPCWSLSLCRPAGASPAPSRWTVGHRSLMYASSSCGCLDNILFNLKIQHFYFLTSVLCQNSFQINGDYFEGVLKKEASKVAQFVKNLHANARDTGLIPGSGRSPGEGNGNPLLYSSLENPMDRGALWTTDHRVSKSQTQLSN